MPAALAPPLGRARAGGLSHPRSQHDLRAAAPMPRSCAPLPSRRHPPPRPLAAPQVLWQAPPRCPLPTPGPQMRGCRWRCRRLPRLPTAHPATSPPKRSSWSGCPRLSPPTSTTGHLTGRGAAVGAGGLPVQTRQHQPGTGRRPGWAAFQQQARRKPPGPTPQRIDHSCRAMSPPTYPRCGWDCKPKT